MISIIKDNKLWLERGAAIAAALLIWQIGAAALGEELLLVSPFTVIKRLGELCMHAEFWRSLRFSSVRIMGGCAIAFVIGSFFAVTASRFRMVAILLWPFLAAIKATPVASFIILCLIWFRAESLSVMMSFLMVMPLIYANVLEGIRQTDQKLLEMARVFHVKRANQIMYMYIPSIIPYFLSAAKVAVGLSWKAGIAAEVIGIPNGSIGEMLYQAKIYLNSADLFAWTAAIIVISMIAEKGVLAVCMVFVKRLEKR